MTLTYSRKKMSISLRVMIVLSLFAALVMSMSVRRAHKHALAARPGTNATKVWLLLLELVSVFQLCYIQNERLKSISSVR
jgi:hypothetical protein